MITIFSNINPIVTKEILAFETARNNISFNLGLVYQYTSYTNFLLHCLTRVESS